jgi:Gluconate 2-dehydrogenase subunit 3
MDSEFYDRQPVMAQTGEPIPPREQPGYYPGYSTLSQQDTWDEATRNVVLKRVNENPPLRFFTLEEAVLMQAVIDCILPQDDRDQDHRISILRQIDERLFSGRIDGYRFENMPPDGEAHRLGLLAIEEIAQHLFQQSFVALTSRQREEVMLTIHDGNPPAGHTIWQQMSVTHYWMLLLQDCVEAYYAHPYVWDEIGFGGPAYPRGYMRLTHGLPEPWERDELRYEWQAPPWSISGEYRPIGGGHDTITSGQEGTH